MVDYIDNFVRLHKEHFKRNKKVISTNKWYEQDNLRGKKSLFDQENELTSSILGRLTAFIKETETNGDRKLKKVQTFIDSTVNIIDIHLKKSKDYLNYNLDVLEEEVETEEEIEQKSNEILFQDYIFNKKISIEDSLNKLNITNSIENVTITFYKNEKATLPMKEVLPLHSSEIKELTDKLKLSNEIVDFEFHIHKEQRGAKIPQWDEKKHYWEQQKDVLTYWNSEYLKIKKGFKVDGYFIHPWLYYHLNFYKTPIPISKDEEPIINPSFRDNEWYFAELLKKAEAEHNKGVCLFGSRRFSKSVLMSSVCDWKALVKANATTSITSGSSGDLEDLTSKIKTSMKYKVPAFILHIQKQDWEKGATELGLKVNAQNTIEHSRHTIKNLDSGAKTSTQKTAGGAPSVYLIEEIGKFAWEKPYLAAIPSFETPFGFKTTVIAVGCVCAGTRVWTNEGALINIEDLQQVQGILGYNGDGVNKEPITWMNPPQKKECVRITTAGGYEIECSIDHPFLMSTSKKINQNTPKSYFKRADQIQVGDSLFKPEKINVFGKVRINEARLIGLLIGDGYYGRNTPSLSIGDDEIYNYVNENYKISTKKEFRTKKGGIFREVIISGQVPLMDRLGMSGQTKKNKQIPKEIFESDEWTVTEFLAGYFDADGFVGYSKTKKIVKIVLTSVNKHLLEDVSYLLTKIGIYSTINKEYNGYGDNPEYKGSQEYCYNLYINRVKDVKEFNHKVRLLCKHKEERIKKVFDREYKHHSGFKKELKFKYDEEYKKGEYFKDKSTNNLNAVRVDKIEYIGEKEVYNLTAGDTNTYIANGFITHNTSGEASLSGDAMKAVANPKSFKFLEMDWDLLEDKMDKEDITWKRRGFASFIPGQMGYKTGFKRIERRFGDFLGIDSEYLNKITILQTDWKTNKQIILDAREEAKNDPLKYQQEIVQYPIDPEECFLSAEKNIFPYKEARLRREYLLETGLWDRRRELHKDSQGKIHTKISNKPLAEFPHTGGNIDAPYLIFEDIPNYTPPQYVYVAGGDFYKQEDSGTDSVGTIYIHKYDLFGDEFAHKLVASYAARPEKFTEFYENCLLLLEAYNAVIFPENEDLGGFQTFLEKRHLEEVYLMRNIDFSSTLEYVQGGRRKWGWTPANSKQKLLNLYANYTKEPVDTVNEKGEIITIKRVQTIDDIGLLSEMINYTKDGNYDRIISAMGSIGFLHFLEKNYIYPKGIRRAMRDGEPEEKKPPKKRERSFYTPPKKRAGFYKSRR